MLLLTSSTGVLLGMLTVALPGSPENSREVRTIGFQPDIVLSLPITRF
jgi:hypothetical protein